MKKTKFKYSFLLFVNSPMFFLAACSVDTPTIEYNRQKQILETSDAKYFVYSSWLNSVLSDKYPRGEDLDEQFRDKNSLFYKDISYFFGLWQQFNIAKDPYFDLKQMNGWAKKASPAQFKELSKVKPFAGISFSLEDLDVLWSLDKITNIRNLLKELVLIYQYFESRPSKPFIDLIPDSLHKFVDLESKEFNWIEYLLTKNPIFEWEYTSKDEADILTSTLVEVKNNKDFNSLFTPDPFTPLSQEPLNIFEEKVKRSGFKGITFLEKNLEGDFALNPQFFSTNFQTKLGFVDEEEKKIFSIQDFENATYFNEAPLATFVLNNKTKDIKELGVEDFWFASSNAPTLEYLNKKYQVVAALPHESDQLVVTVKVTDMSDSRKFFYYQTIFNSNGKTPVAPFSFDYNPLFINPQHLVDKKQEEVVTLRFVARVLPILSTSIPNQYFFTLHKTLFESDAAKKKLAFHFWHKDSDLLKRVKIFFLKEGFRVEVKEKKLDTLVKELGLFI